MEHTPAVGGGRARRSPDELILLPSPEHPDLALVIGRGGVPEQIGRVIATASSGALNAIQGAGLLTSVGALAAMDSGRWVQLTAESAAKLSELGPTTTQAGDAMLGVLRGDAGQFAHVLQFNPAMLDPTGATLLAGLAMQAALARMERKLDSLADKVDLLLEGSQLDVESTILAARQTIRRVEQHLDERGVVDADDWGSLSSLEHPLHQAHALVLRWLDPLRALLTVEGARVKPLVEDLQDVIELRDIATWLRLYVWAEFTMTRWYMLYLARQWSVAPQHVGAATERVLAEAAERRQTLLTINEDLQSFLARDPDDVIWMDRIRLVNRYRLGVLRREVAKVHNIYAEALGENALEVPAYLDPDGDAGTGPLIAVERAHQRISRGASLALDAGRQQGEEALDWAGDALTDVRKRLAIERPTGLPRMPWQRGRQEDGDALEPGPTNDDKP